MTADKIIIVPGLSEISHPFNGLLTMLLSVPALCSLKMKYLLKSKHRLLCNININTNNINTNYYM